MLLNELKTLFRRRRTLALLGGLALLPVLISVAVRISNGPSGGEGPPFLSQVSENGFFAALVGLSVVIAFFLPLSIGVVAGDTIAGEANQGTLRYVLVAPVKRYHLLLVKYVSVLVFALAATVVVVLAGMIAGSILFGIHDVVSLSATTLALPNALVRALLAALVVALSMAGLAAIGLFISTLTDQPVGAMAATTVAAIVSQIADNIPQLHTIHGALFTHYWMSFVDLFRDPATYGSMGKGLLLQVVWVVIFGSAAWARFSKKDVLA